MGKEKIKPKSLSDLMENEEYGTIARHPIANFLVMEYLRCSAGKSDEQKEAKLREGISDEEFAQLLGLQPVIQSEVQVISSD